MCNAPYTTTPHAYHAQTFPLNPAPFLEPLTRHVPAPAPNPVLVLDVGCGSGRDLDFEVVEAFTNASVLGTGEKWLGYVLGNSGQIDLHVYSTGPGHRGENSKAST